MPSVVYVATKLLILSVVMLSVIMLSVIMLSVLAPPNLHILLFFSMAGLKRSQMRQIRGPVS